jgi:hypothetical protein
MIINIETVYAFASLTNKVGVPALGINKTILESALKDLPRLKRTSNIEPKILSMRAGNPKRNC